MTLSDAAVSRLRGALERPDAGERYEIGDLLGRGGMGAVYQAHDRVLARDVALKVIAIDADATALAARLTRESRVLAQLEHPGIVAVHDAGTLADGRPFYVMRLVRGERLDDVAGKTGRGELLRLFLRISSAVAYAHARGVVHRDLKPGNIMVGSFGEVLVLDWGVAKSATEAPLRAATSHAPSRDEITADGVAIGTPGFMAPEQATGGARDADARADVYSLGAILRILLASGAEKVPPPLASVVARATTVDPATRYATVNELADDVRRWLDGERVAAHAEGVAERGIRLYRRNRTLILLLVAYAAVRVAIFAWRGI